MGDFSPDCAGTDGTGGRLLRLGTASTVKTLLARLVGKGAVRQCGRKRFYFYRPLLSREEYREAAGERLAAQAFDDDCAAMVSFFVRRGKLSAADIAELKRLLDEQETENE